MLWMVDLKVKNSRWEYSSRKLPWPPASKWHGRSFLLVLNLLIQTTDETSTGLSSLVWGLQVCILAVVLQQGWEWVGLWGRGFFSLIQLRSFCSAFPITSSTVSSQRAQKYFAESSNCKVEMVRLDDLRDLSTFIEWRPSLVRKIISPLGSCLYQNML